MYVCVFSSYRVASMASGGTPCHQFGVKGILLRFYVTCSDE